MNKSQNTKNEQQKDLCITSEQLTEQWKKGELYAGWYYIKIADIVFIDFFEGKVWKNKKDEYIDEVLAPVPSYEKWKEKLEENAHLKELLKEVKDYLPEFETPMDILAKIDEALQ